MKQPPGMMLRVRRRMLTFLTISGVVAALSAFALLTTLRGHSANAVPSTRISGVEASGMTPSAPPCISLASHVDTWQRTPASPGAAASGKYTVTYNLDGDTAKIEEWWFSPPCAYDGRESQLFLRQDEGERFPYGADILATQADGSVVWVATSNGHVQPASGPVRDPDFSNPASWYTYSPPFTLVPAELTPGTTFEATFTLNFGGTGDIQGRVVSAGVAKVAGSDLFVVHLTLHYSERYPGSVLVRDFNDMAWAPSLHLFVSRHISSVRRTAGRTSTPPALHQSLLSLSPS